MSKPVVAYTPTPRQAGEHRRLGEVAAAMLVWEEPPPDGRGSADWGRLDHDAIANLLREHPGRWARICNGSTFSASAIRKGQQRAYRPSGSYEAVTRLGAVYARYIGEVGSDV